ncbi:MAG TPA: PAS domain S-box protein [Pyrinomonadaceae bacterium]|nr:PAS domain S-box protein [Pyrinomonadaceae bacterium]
MSFLNHLPGFAWMKDLKGRYVYANSALQTLKEYRDGCIGLTDADLLRQDLADIYRANDQKVIAERKPLEILEPYLVNGEKHFLLVSKFPIFDKSGALIMIGGSSIDISAQARTEERLREYERVVEGLEEMIAVVDRDYRYLLANQAFLNHRNMSRDQVVGHFIWEVLSPEIFTATVKSRLDRAFSGEVVRYEMQHHYPGLGSRDLFISYFPIENATGIDRVACVLQDVTTRNQTEGALRQSEHQMAEAQSLAHVGSWNWEIESNVLGWSDELFNIFGEDPKTFTPTYQAFLARLHPDDRAATTKAIEDCFLNPWPLSHRPRIIRNNGETRTLDCHISVVCDEAGKPVRMFGACQDITLSVRAEQARREAEERYRDIFENAGEGIFQSTPAGRYIAANPALARMHGFDSPEELMRGRTDISRAYVDPARREEFKRLLETNGFVRDFEFQLSRKDGSKISVTVNARVVRDEKGVVQYYEGTGQDITERKKAEARSAAFASLARKLSGTSTQLEAARIIVDTAWELFGWDACNLDLYDSALDRVEPMLNLDTIDGKLVDVTPPIRHRAPTERSRRVIEHGPLLILRKETIESDQSAVLFGDVTRPSASIMAVPVLHGAKVIGLLSIQSYTTNAYDPASLAHLAALADHCGEALNRIRAEQSLRESEERFRQMAENFEDVIWIADRDLEHILYINPAYEKIFGRSRESVYERFDSVLESVHAADRFSVEQMLTRQKQGDNEACEYRIVRPDGSTRWILRRSFPIRDANGHIQRIAGIAQDITERKRAESQLRESEERYRDLVDNSTELICTHDLNGLVLSANPAVCAALGCELNEVVGGNVRDILAPTVRHQFDDYLATVRNGGAAAGIMFVQNKSGQRRIWEYNNSLRTEGVTTPIVRGMARDITEERRVQKALYESEERYRELFENSRDAIYVHDLTGRYVSVNRAAETLSGFTRDEIMGKHYSNFITPKHLKNARESFCIKLDAPIETTYEAEIICKNGTCKAVEVSSRMIYKDGVAVAVQGTARDITERKRAQQALQTYARRLLEAQEAERQNIARELHDEIGQILTAVSLNLHSIQKSFQIDSCLPNIVESIQVVEDALSRVRELSLELRPSLLDDLGLAAALRWYIGRYTARSGIATEITGDAEVGRISHEVETACFRITQEALTNAARHSHATRATVHIEQTNGNLQLRVTDNGIGFESDQLLYGMASALALGLRGMQERALAVKGHVQVISNPGEGTQVTLNVPVQ